MSDEPRDPNDAPGDGAARPSDREIHGAGDPPRDALADATRRLVVDDLRTAAGLAARAQAGRAAGAVRMATTATRSSATDRRDAPDQLHDLFAAAVGQAPLWWQRGEPARDLVGGDDRARR